MCIGKFFWRWSQKLKLLKFWPLLWRLIFAPLEAKIKGRRNLQRVRYNVKVEISVNHRPCKWWCCDLIEMPLMMPFRPDEMILSQFLVFWNWKHSFLSNFLLKKVSWFQVMIKVFFIRNSWNYDVMDQLLLLLCCYCCCCSSRVE